MTSPAPVVALLLAGGAGAFAVLAWVTRTRRVDLGAAEPAAFVALSIGAAVWAWSYALQFVAGALAAKVAFDAVRWLGVATVGAAWPVFGLTVAGDGDLLTPRRVAVLAGVPALTALLALTNPVHGLVYVDVGLADPAVGTPLAVAGGPALGAFLLYSYAVDAAVVWRLWRGVRAAEGTARTRRTLVLAAGVLPLSVGAAGLLLAGPGRTVYVDYTPAVFCVTTALTGVAVARYRLLDPTVVARDHVIGRLDDPVVVVDGAGAVRAANPAGERLLGADADAGVRVEEAFADQPALLSALREREPARVEATGPANASEGAVDPPRGSGGPVPARPAADGGGRAIERGGTAAPGSGDGRAATGGEARRTGPGDARTFDVLVTPLDGTDGGTVLVFRDVTDRRLAERRLTVLNRVLRHDLRNDVNVVQGYLGLVRGTLREHGVDEAEPYLDVADDRMRDLVTLSDRARTVDDVAAGEVSVERVDVARAAADRVAQARREHPEAELSYDAPDGPAEIEAMAVFHSVVDNLIENAIEHSDRDRPRVDVRVTVVDGDPGAVTFAVSDDGPGIPPPDRAVVAHDDEGTVEDASGLGLWLVNWVVTATGGSVAVSDAEPRGTVVTVTHPRAPPDPLGTGA